MSEEPLLYREYAICRDFASPPTLPLTGPMDRQDMVVKRKLEKGRGQ